MKINFFITFIVIAFLFQGCGKNSKQKSMVTTNNKVKSINENQEDLLSGISSAVCYSGFRTGQHPDRGEGANNPSNAEILEDLQIIKNEMGFGLIRLYDSGINSKMVLEIIEKEGIGLKVMLGVWLNAELSAHETCEWLTEPIPQDELDKNKAENLQELQRGIQLANQYKNIVVALNVGNEALVDWNDHKMHVDTVIAYCQKVKMEIEQPVTVADNYEWWAAEGKKLANELDFISIHVYPVWEGKDINEGLSYSIENVQKVRNALPNAKIVISEAGWASVATEFGERASEEKQAQYFKEFMNWSKENNITTFFFEAFDEDWKGDANNPLGAEKHWGLYTVDRKPKQIMQHK